MTSPTGVTRLFSALLLGRAQPQHRSGSGLPPADIGSPMAALDARPLAAPCHSLESGHLGPACFAMDLYRPFSGAGIPSAAHR